MKIEDVTITMQSDAPYTRQVCWACYWALFMNGPYSSLSPSVTLYFFTIFLLLVNSYYLKTIESIYFLIMHCLFF